MRLGISGLMNKIIELMFVFTFSLISLFTYVYLNTVKSRFLLLARLTAVVERRMQTVTLWDSWKSSLDSLRTLGFSKPPTGQLEANLNENNGILIVMSVQSNSAITKRQKDFLWCGSNRIHYQKNILSLKLFIYSKCEFDGCTRFILLSHPASFFSKLSNKDPTQIKHLNLVIFIITDNQVDVLPWSS